MSSSPPSDPLRSDPVPALGGEMDAVAALIEDAGAWGATHHHDRESVRLVSRLVGALHREQAAHRETRAEHLHTLAEMLRVSLHRAELLASARAVCRARGTLGGLLGLAIAELEQLVELVERRPGAPAPTVEQLRQALAALEAKPEDGAWVPLELDPAGKLAAALFTERKALLDERAAHRETRAELETYRARYAEEERRAAAGRALLAEAERAADAFGAAQLSRRLDKTMHEALEADAVHPAPPSQPAHPQTPSMAGSPPAVDPPTLEHAGEQPGGGPTPAAKPEGSP